MNVGILGLGLIGGSMARAYSKAGHTVLAYDLDQNILEFAHLAGAVHGVLNDETVGNCDCILLSVHASGCISWLEDHAEQIAPNTLVIDCCGVKEQICSHCFPLAEKFGFTFVGGHPMAGSHHSGFKYSRSNLFQGAPMVLVPPRFDDPQLLQRTVDALSPCKFGSFSVTTAGEHDAMIAFTSQMPHLLSNAFIKSPTARKHKGFSAGSYKDLTRVAWLNPIMWTELMLSNKENVLFELETYMKSLEAYQDALQANDTDALIALLDEGKRCKEEVDG
ncbi:MAG: prephenate dehydrogenase [Oscillospiraceae bacterium]|nr:prephenate dehydrogenase [Oscillospiraceae bacterium]